jgi:hypothetical protein
MLSPWNAKQRGKSFTPMKPITPMKQGDSMAVDPCLDQAATLWDRLFSGK